jgi:hypothetical protein
MMKAMLWALVLALILAYAGLGVEMAFPFLVIACALAFYHHSQVAGAAAVAAAVILAGFLFALGMRQYAFGVSEASLGMLMAATAVAAWKWRMQTGGNDFIANRREVVDAPAESRKEKGGRDRIRRLHVEDPRIPEK